LGYQSINNPVSVLPFFITAVAAGSAHANPKVGGKIESSIHNFISVAAVLGDAVAVLIVVHGSNMQTSASVGTTE
jgi:hypothetical protein